MAQRLKRAFFSRDCLEVAPDLVGKLLACRQPDGTILRLRISQTEAYRGETDTACHASHGRTKRAEVLYMGPGTIYVYLCYGIHWLLNVVTGRPDEPQGVLIRACVEADGPGRLTRRLGVTGELNRQDIVESQTLWLEDDGLRPLVLTDKRVGIGYASQEDQDRLWRFKLGPDQADLPLE